MFSVKIQKKPKTRFFFSTLKKSNKNRVFSGVNEDPSVYPLIGNLESPKTTITGILERQNYSLSIDLALSINQNAKMITFIHDQSSSGSIIKSEIEIEIEKNKKIWPPSRSFQFKYFSELQHFLLNDPYELEPEKNILYFASFSGFFNEKGRGVSSKTKNISTPLFFFNFFLLIFKKKHKGQTVMRWVTTNRNGTEISQVSPSFSINGGLLSMGQDPRCKI